MTLACLDMVEWLNQAAIFSYAPQKVIIGWGKANWHDQPLQDAATWFYFPDYFLEDACPWVCFEHSAILSIDELILLLQAVPAETHEPLVFDPPCKSGFSQGFQELTSLFETTELEKVVLYAFSRSTPLQSSHRKQLLLNTLHYAKNTPTYIYGFWNVEEGILGATPELLFRIDENYPSILQTMALAGTQKSNSLVNEMLSDGKLLHEHQIVVDDIASRLSPLGEVDLGALQILVLPLLSHLYMPIKVELNRTYNFLTFVKALHPTPALGGFPRELASKWLVNYNRHLARGRFGAPTGFWDSQTNQSACYVAIRNVMWDQEKSSIGAGCGIVSESDIENEWAEILLKTESIFSRL